jgi:exonuclease VII small subunit
MFSTIAPPSPKPEPARTPAAPPGSFEWAIQRLEAVVEQETQALRSRTAIDLKEFNDRKSQGLLELNRALRAFDGIAGDKAAQTRLSGLRVKLDANRAVLKTHLDAVREVAAVLADAIQDAESDGTYSPSIRSAGRGP